MSVGQWRQALRGIQAGGAHWCDWRRGRLVGRRNGFDILRRPLWQDRGMGNPRHRGRPGARHGVRLGRPPAQRRLGRYRGRRLGRLRLLGPDPGFSAGFRARDCDHNTRRVDRILHRTGNRVTQARLADGGAQRQPQRPRGAGILAGQTGYGNRPGGRERRRPFRRPVGAAPARDIRQEGKNFYVSSTAGGAINVNRMPVNGRQVLKNGDRIEVGGTLFLFRERAQAPGS